MTRIAVVGLGIRATLVLVELAKLDPGLRLVAVADPNPEGVRQRLAHPGLPPSTDVAIFADVDELLEHADEFDGIVVGTPCNLHTPIAVKAAATGLPLFLEKPVAVDEAQVRELAKAFEGRLDSVVVSFPLRMTPLLRAVFDVVQSGRLGAINQIQAFNYVAYGGIYFGQWYRNYDQTGGMWLQKATHDFDYVNLLMGSQPTGVVATETQKIYGGDMPHDLRCSQCTLVEECVESPTNFARRGDDGAMGYDDHYCAFSREIKNHDAGSALITYADGAHASYSQNFVSRRSAHRRGAIITGYKATVEFDWYTEVAKIIDHHDNQVDTIKVNQAAEGHLGGDRVLATQFLDLIHNQSKVDASLADGLLSVSMCLAARRSASSGTFERVPTIEELLRG